MFLPFTCLHVVAWINGVDFKNVDALAIWFCIFLAKFDLMLFFLQKRVLSLATREYMLGWTTDISVWHEAAAFAWHNVPH